MAASQAVILGDNTEANNGASRLGAGAPEGAILLTEPIAQHLLSSKTGKPLTPELGAGEDGVVTIVSATKGVVSQDKYTDFYLHIEWFSPPGGLGQLAGNSGVFLQGIYEIQVLGSKPAPRKPKKNEAGALYDCKAPDVNASTGPGTWQAYDIAFTAARYAEGKRVSKATVTAWHNGVKIHDAVLLDGGTSGGYPNSQEKNLEQIHGVLAGPIYLQSHLSMAKGPVQYRNIWVLPLPPEEAFGNDTP